MRSLPPVQCFVTPTPTSFRTDRLLTLTPTNSNVQNGAGEGAFHRNRNDNGHENGNRAVVVVGFCTCYTYNPCVKWVVVTFYRDRDGNGDGNSKTYGPFINRTVTVVVGVLV